MMASPGRVFSGVTALLVVTALTLALLAVAGGYVNSTDGHVVRAVDQALLDHGRLWLTEAEAPYPVGKSDLRIFAVSPQGRIYSPFGHLAPLAAFPFYASGRLGESLIGAEGHALSSFSFSVSNVLPTALALWLWWALALRLGFRPRRAWWWVLLAAFGTPVAFQAVSSWREPLTTLGLAIACYGLVRLWSKPARARWAVAISVGAALLLLNKEVNVLLAAPIGLAAAFRIVTGAERRAAVGSLAGLAAPVLLALGAHLAVVGSRFGPGALTCYGPGRVSAAADPLEILRGFTIGSEHGMLLYATLPLLGLLAVPFLADRSRVLRAGVVITFLAFLLLHLVVTNAVGGKDTWAPRHLVPLFPGLVLALGAAAQRWGRGLGKLLLVVPVCWSLFVSALPLVQPYHLYSSLRRVAEEEGVTGMPWRVPGMLATARVLVTEDPPRVDASTYGASGDWSAELTGDRVLDGRWNIWWLRADVGGKVRIAGGILLAVSLLLLWQVRRRLPE